MAEKLISQTRNEQVDELKRRILAQARMITWMNQVLLTYDQGDDMPSDVKKYRLVAGAATGYFRQAAYRSRVTDAIDKSINDLLKELWYDSIVSEVRCIQGLNKQTGRYSILKSRLDGAQDRLERDRVRLSCRIGHGPEMVEFEHQWEDAQSEIVRNVQMMCDSVSPRYVRQAVPAQHLRVIDGGASDGATADEQPVADVAQQLG